jgi:ribosomal protein S18 acetylase RimI-like enzyme
MATTVSLREVVDALDIASDEMSSYVNRSTGQVTTIPHEELRLAEEEPDPDMPDWQEEVVAEARKVLESKDWLELPSKFDIHEWEIMDGFGRSLSKAADRAEIADAIHGNGAFRNFKGTIRRRGIEEAWYAYRQHALEDIAREWLAEHGFEVDEGDPTSSVAPDGARSPVAEQPIAPVSDMQVRCFEDSDEAHVIQLWERCGLLRPWNDPSKDIARKKRMQRELFLVGTIGDEIVASVMGGYDGHRGWVYYLAVDPNRRRQGLASALMTEVERRLRELGCAKINLQVRRDNLEAISFYERIGFKEDAVVSLGKRLERDD